MKSGDIYQIWLPGDIQKKAWYYLHHREGLPVFVDEWPPLKSEGFLSLCLAGLQYEFVGSPKYDYYNLEDEDG